MKTTFKGFAVGNILRNKKLCADSGVDLYADFQFIVRNA